MKVKIEYFRDDGMFLFYKVKETCLECELTYTILHSLQAELFTGKDIRIVIKPYFNNLIPLLFRKGFKPPLIYVNRRLFSSGVVPNTEKLLQRIEEILGENQLGLEDVSYHNYRKKRIETFNEPLPLLYYSPSCPHCRALKTYLDFRGVQYTQKNVSDDPVYREDFKKISPTGTIPLLIYKGQMISGYKLEETKTLLELKPSVDLLRRTVTAAVPVYSKDVLQKTIFGAKQVLEGNRDGDVTKASSHLYPHQWSWDAAFIARGLLHYDPPKAYREIDSLFRGQWSDGFLPHIIFNNNYLDHFPGPSYWKGELSGRVPGGVFTSGISQPPVHASMLSRIMELDPDKERAGEWLKKIYPKLESLHDYYFKYRRSSLGGLIFLVHPWESGLDNAPLWDRPLKNIRTSTKWSKKMQKEYDQLAAEGKRPARSYIDKYSYLVESLFSRNYDWQKIGEKHEFRICDVLFNSVLCRSEEDLALIAEQIGEDPQPHKNRSNELKKAINKHLWDDKDGFYYDYDLVADEYIKKDTVFSYLPLYSRIPTPGQAKRLINHLKTHCFCVAGRDCMGIPSYDMCKIDYDGEFYWRGPIWYNMSWYVYHGFKNYGYKEDAQWLKKSMFDLVIQNGFYEYYKPENGKGLGAEGFSWTAALFLDLVEEPELPEL